MTGGLPALDLLNELLFRGWESERWGEGHVGAALRGADESEFLHPAASLLHHVLLQGRGGLPIALAAVYASVAARAGLPVRVLNMPRQVVVGFGEPGSAGERFVDVYGGAPGAGGSGGRIMDW